MDEKPRQLWGKLRDEERKTSVVYTPLWGNKVGSVQVEAKSASVLTGAGVISRLAYCYINSTW